MPDKNFHIDAWVDGKPVAVRHQRVRVRRIKWLPFWFPFNRKWAIVYQFDEPPAAGTQVIVEYSIDA